MSLSLVGKKQSLKESGPLRKIGSPFRETESPLGKLGPQSRKQGSTFGKPASPSERSVKPLFGFEVKNENSTKSFNMPFMPSLTKSKNLQCPFKALKTWNIESQTMKDKINSQKH